MRHKFEGILMVFLTITFGVILVGSIVLPQVFISTSNTFANVNNGTDYAVFYMFLSNAPNATNATDININSSTAIQNLTFVVSHQATTTAVLTVAYNLNYTANATQLLSATGALIGNLSDVSGIDNNTNVSSITLSGVYMSTANVTNNWSLRFGFNTTAGYEVNITDANLSYVNYTYNASQNISFTTTNIYTTPGANLTIAFNHNYTPNWTVVATSSGTTIGNFTAATNNASNVTTVVIPSGNLNSGAIATQSLQYTTMSLYTQVNVTDSNLTYYQLNTQQAQGWDAGSTAMWAVVPLVIIASLILIVVGGKK